MRNLAYGPDERHMLDVFAPATAPQTLRPEPPRRLPVLLFVHGGGFFGGGRRVPPASSPFYDNVMLLAARNGMAGVNATYRLVPQPPLARRRRGRGSRAALGPERLGAYGGDPSRIVRSETLRV